MRREPRRSRASNSAIAGARRLGSAGPQAAASQGDQAAPTPRRALSCRHGHASSPSTSRFATDAVHVRAIVPRRGRNPAGLRAPGQPVAVHAFGARGERKAARRSLLPGKGLRSRRRSRRGRHRHRRRGDFISARARTASSPSVSTLGRRGWACSDGADRGRAAPRLREMTGFVWPRTSRCCASPASGSRPARPGRLTVHLPARLARSPSRYPLRRSSSGVRSQNVSATTTCFGSR